VGSDFSVVGNDFSLVGSNPQEMLALTNIKNQKQIYTHKSNTGSINTGFMLGRSGHIKP
jgi:hypothetical protein